MDDYRDGLHWNGIHLQCKLAPVWAGAKRIGDGTWKSCPYAGKIERFHGHDFDGPLPCGCTEYH